MINAISKGIILLAVVGILMTCFVYGQNKQGEICQEGGCDDHFVDGVMR